MTSVSEQIFKRHFSSEAARDELIGKTAASIEQDVTAALLTDDAEAQEVADDMTAFMDAERGAYLIRLALRGFASELREELPKDMAGSVRRIAEHRATRQAEELTPDAFKH